MTLNMKTFKNNVGKRENAQVTSIFFFSHNVFYAINPFPNKPWFLYVCRTSLLKHWEKEKLLVMSNFSFPHSVFYQFGELFSIFIKFKYCLLQTFNLEESKICRLGKGLVHKSSLLSANALKLDHSEILSSGKGIISTCFEFEQF